MYWQLMYWYACPTQLSHAVASRRASELVHLWSPSLALTLVWHWPKKRLNSWSSIHPLLSFFIFPGTRSYHGSFLLSNLSWIFWPDWIFDQIHRAPDNCPHHLLGCTTSLWLSWRWCWAALGHSLHVSLTSPCENRVYTNHLPQIWNQGLQLVAGFSWVQGLFVEH